MWGAPPLFNSQFYIPSIQFGLQPLHAQISIIFFLDDVVVFYVPLHLFYIIGPPLKFLMCISFKRNLACFFVFYFFLKIKFSKYYFRNTIRVSNSWIQIRPDKPSGLIRVQTVCKYYQQTTLVAKELNVHTEASSGCSVQRG